MLQVFLIAILSAVFSSALTYAVAWYAYRRHIRVQMERRIQDLHEDIGRIVEIRVRKALGEALNDTTTADILRDRTWQAARTGADFVNDGLNVLLGRNKRRQE